MENSAAEILLKDVIAAIQSSDWSSIENLENVLNNAAISDSDKKTATDQALRSVLREYLSNDIKEEEDREVKFEKFINFVIVCTKKKFCTNNLSILLLSDIFDTMTLDKCEKIFDFVEKNVTTWTSEPFFTNGKHHLLRMCNDILRRLSKSQNTIFCGRIQLFLAQLFPLEEKSALNLMSTFHLDNITVYKKNPSEFADDITSDSMDTEDGELIVNPVDYNLYVKFWSIQEYFRYPVTCYSNSGWRAFKININEVLKVFESHKIEHHSIKKKTKDKEQSEIVALSTIMRKCEGSQNYFAKYLTNEKLLNLQLNDSQFRRYFLVQVLIIFQYLTGKVRFKTDLQLLSDSQNTWIKETGDRVNNILAELPPNGSKFAKAVQHVLAREENWINWKNEGCPSFVRMAPKTPLVPEKEEKPRERKARKRNIGEDYLNKSSKRIHMGTSELTRLWNLNPDNMEACKAESRLKFLPRCEDFFQEAIEQAEPGAGIEDEYLVVKKPHFQWRALRLLARRSHHFFTPSNHPFKALPDYLSTVIDALAKDLKPAQTSEAKIEVKQEPIDMDDVNQ